METRKINTFHAPKWNDRQTLKRFEITKQFVKKYLRQKSGYVLDIGNRNPFGENLGKYFNLEYIHTKGDLNFEWEISKNVEIKVVFCFETLEHLINPGNILDKVFGLIQKDAQVFISVPRTPRWLGWNPAHFHEFDCNRFNYMMNYFGYKEIAHEQHTLWHNWKWYLHGIRPIFFRWNVGRNKTHWYYLERSRIGKKPRTDLSNTVKPNAAGGRQGSPTRIITCLRAG